MISFSCASRGDNCVNYYSTSAPSSGCFLNFMSLSAAVCCSVKVVPRTGRDDIGIEEDLAAGEKYRAVELSVPNVVAQFKGEKNEFLSLN